MLRTYLGPVQWQHKGGLAFWAAPAGTVGWVDLAPPAQQAVAGGTARNALFVTQDQALPSEYTLLAAGDPAEAQATAKQRAAWRSVLGFTPAGATVADLVWDHLTRGADPSGDAGPKPLMPQKYGRGSVRELSLHRTLKQEPFNWGDDTTPLVRGMLQREFRQVMGEATAGRLGDRQQHRRVLDFWCEQYGIADWRELVPADLLSSVPGRLPHATTLNDNFTRANADPLGASSEGWSWVEATGDWDIISNQAASMSPPDIAYADSALSSADHYGQITVAVFGPNPIAPTCRHSSVADTWYGALQWDGFSFYQLYKSVAGTLTALGSGYGLTSSAGLVLKAEASGSAIKGYESGVQRLSVTDTAISGNLKCGMYSNHTVNRVSAFQAADLGGGGGTVFQTYYYRLLNQAGAL